MAAEKGWEMSPIDGGPGRWNLAVALMDGKIVFFTLLNFKGEPEPGSTRVEIKGGSSDCSRREKWTLKGFCFLDGKTPTEFRAIYNLRTRKGELYLHTGKQTEGLHDIPSL